MENLHISADIATRAKKTKLLLMDCDGVLTDGKLYFSERGEELKVFHVRDGQGLANWHNAGFKSGIITGRGSEKILQKRAAELGIHYLKTHSLNKAKDFEDILQQTQLISDEVAFVGDDLGDICLMKQVGLPIAVADAVNEVLAYAVLKTKTNGGYGVIREIVDLILKVKKNF